MSSFWNLVKKGNRSSLYAALGNLFLAAAKGVVAYGFLHGANGAMKAEFSHSLQDTIMQLFVFAGSILALKAPTKKFPLGFRNAINLVCIFAVIFGGIMAFQTIEHGVHALQHPEPVVSSGLYLAAAVLLISIAVEGFVLFKASKEIMEEVGEEAKGFAILGSAMKNLKFASPATKLVFLEDMVAVLGAFLAFIAVGVSIIASNYFPGALSSVASVDSIISIIIGALMMFVAIRLGYDNATGLIGVAAPDKVEDMIEEAIMSNKHVSDLRINVIKQGDFYKVEGTVELVQGLELEDSDDIVKEIKRKIKETEPDVVSIVLEHEEDDGIPSRQEDEITV